MQPLRCLVAGAAIGLSGLVPAVALAQSSPVVVELFTSQGCSSCPPADEYMARLADRDDVIALSLHVDYWDYLGWADSFAQASFTDRQRKYARANGDRAIYTPQIIVDGTDRVQGVRPMLMADLVRAHRDRVRQVQLGLDRAEGRITIRLSAEPPLSRNAVVQLVRYLPQAQVTIERGENEGRSATYHNIVTLWDTLTRWDGQGPITLTAEVPGGDPVVVIVQSEGFGPVLAAERLR
jgi:hypothetical protein